MSTIGTEKFGLTPDAAAQFITGVYADLNDLKDIPVPDGTTLGEIADTIVDTIAGYNDQNDISPDALPHLIRDALTQLLPEEGETTSSPSKD